jgi:hypothetical protein
MKIASIILLVAGGLLSLLTLGVFAITLILMATSGGKIDPDEAAPALVGSGCCCSFSGVVLIVGIVLLIVGRSQRQA